MSKLLGDGKLDLQTVEQMVAFCVDYPEARWAAYQNHAMDSAGLGHLRCMAIGPECTFKEAPERHPDTQEVIGWRYLFVGWADLETGMVVEGERV